MKTKHSHSKLYKRARASTHNSDLAVDANDDDCVERGSCAEKADHVSVPAFRPDPVQQDNKGEADEGLVEAVEHPEADLEGAEVEVPLTLQERRAERFFGRNGRVSLLQYF